MNRYSFALPAIWIIAGIPAAAAQSTTYEFTGTGYVCTAPMPGMDYECEYDIPFYGTVTLEVLAAGPTPPDGETDGLTYAWDTNDWIRPDFAIHWDGGSFHPTPFPGPTVAMVEAAVYNNFMALSDSPVIDELFNYQAYYTTEPSGCQRSAGLARISRDLSWLDDVSYDLGAGLAPGPDATNVICFGNNTYDCDGEPERYAAIQLASFTRRGAAVTIEIDIKPGSPENSVNPHSNGIITVGILGSERLDATQVEVTSVRFGPAGAASVHGSRIGDVNRDGFPDMVLQFRTHDAGLSCNDTSALLTGELANGLPMNGTDSVRAAGCAKPATK